MVRCIPACICWQYAFPHESVGWCDAFPHASVCEMLPACACLWDAFLYASVGGMHSHTHLMVICILCMHLLAIYLLVGCVPLCIWWQYVHPHTSVGKMCFCMHLAGCIPTRICWQDASTPPLHIFWKLVSTRVSSWWSIMNVPLWVS